MIELQLKRAKHKEKVKVKTEPKAELLEPEADSTGELMKSTVKVIDFRTPKVFAVITLKFNQTGLSIGKFVHKVQMEWQKV